MKKLSGGLLEAWPSTQDVIQACSFSRRARGGRAGHSYRVTVSWCCVERLPSHLASWSDVSRSLLCHNWLFAALQLPSLSRAASALVACLGGSDSQMRRAWWCAGVRSPKITFNTFKKWPHLATPTTFTLLRAAAIQACLTPAPCAGFQLIQEPHLTLLSLMKSAAATLRAALWRGPCDKRPRMAPLKASQELSPRRTGPAEKL
eukprot:XP_028336382.1 uncharacterized protein LOC114484430 [Physeter catodon]